LKFNNKYHLGKNVTIGRNVQIGDNSVVYDNVVLGDNTTIANDCVIGEPLNEYYRNANYNNPQTIIGPNSLIRSHAIIYAGSSFGENFSCGHRVTIREKTTLGAHCSVGTLSDLQGYVTFGNYCRLHSNVHIGQKSKLGNFVFIYPYVVLTNDPTPPSDLCIGPEIADYAQIATMSVVLPGVKIGKHALIGAGSVVSKSVADYSLTLGNPAKHIKDVREIKSKYTGISHYPWPENFSRGMPWSEVGYAEWAKSQDELC
jgi:acetyltransferase-like isoleucine patch superfamily enzyme